MSYRKQPHGFGRQARTALLAALGLIVPGLAALPARALMRTPAPWHIESFCDRGAVPARRCLVRARQGIVVFQLVELPSPPAVRWDKGIAVLISGASDRSRQLRFYLPPQQLSAPFTRVRAYDPAQQLVARYADGRVHVRAMFAGERDLAALALPADIGADTLQLHFEGRRLQASWRDTAGRPRQQTLQASIEPPK